MFVNCTWIHSNGQMYQKWPLIGEVLVSDMNTVIYVSRSHSRFMLQDINRHWTDRGRFDNQIVAFGSSWGRHEGKIKHLLHMSRPSGNSLNINDLEVCCITSPPLTVVK